MTRGFFSDPDDSSDEDTHTDSVDGATKALSAVSLDSNSNNNNTIEEEEEPPVDSDERLLRRLLKKHLKQRNRLRKYETRMQQAHVRSDPKTEQRARQEWESFVKSLQDDPNSVLNYKAQTPKSGIHFDHGSNSNTNNNGLVQSRCCQLNQGTEFQHIHTSVRSLEERDTSRVREGGAWLLKIRQSLVDNMLASHKLREHQKLAANQNEIQQEEQSQEQSQPSQQSTTKTRKLTSKEIQTLRASELKFNMNKGTQTESMFDDELALLGYTRQKFFERAHLVFRSLDRLDPSYRECNGNDNGNGNDNASAEKESHEDTSGNNPPETESNNAMMDSIWERLLSCQQVVSIGCGPGCDAVGTLGFLESHGVTLTHGIILFDYVMERWKESVLDTLMPLIVPKHVPCVELLHCNVEEPLLPQEANSQSNSSVANEQALLELTKDNSAKDHRLIVVSYLITETRGRWRTFFQDLLVLLKGTQSLLLLKEPNAWQLREFLRFFGQGQNESELLIRAHVWLDSSRDLPHLQNLDSRNGPAILLVCTN